MGLCVGEDGAFLIDDQFAPLTDKIRATIAKITDKPLKFVLNTHWHGDHTGGNENLGQAGALIVAHENVRKRMSTKQFIKAFNRESPASPKVALPAVTFTDSVTLHLNDEDIHAFHVAPAHTDGDSIVHFKKANVMHLGDTFFNGMYPFIDVSSGGSVDGVIASATRVLEIADADTKIIPGHGPLSNEKELEAYRDMLQTVRDRVKKLKDAGKTAAEVVASLPTKDFDEKWGGGFMKAAPFTQFVYESLN